MLRLLAVLAFVCMTASAFAQQTQPVMARVDSTTGAALTVAIRASGSALIGAGDSVQVTIEHATPTDIVILGYVAAKSATGDIATALSWQCIAENVITIYGDESKTVHYMVIR